MMSPMSSPRKALRADARNRTARTFAQGLAVAVLTVVVPIAYGALEGLGAGEAIDWRVTATAAGTAAGMAALAYLWRVVLDPSGVASLEPKPDPVAGFDAAALARIVDELEAEELELEEPDEDVIAGHPANGPR